MSKKDNSPQVHQDEKFKDKLFIRELNWTDKQKQFIDLASNKETKILFIKGPAGSSKTLLSIYCALKLLNEKKISDILLLRSAVESADKSIGFLPGTIEEKLHFYSLPFLDKLEELLNKNDIARLQKEKRISTFPVNFLRGMSWNAKCIIMDETQNSTIKEIITALTRIGQFSKCFVLADPSQTDLTNGKRGAFENIFNMFQDQESKDFGIRTFTFDEEDIMRSEIVKFLVKRFQKVVINH